MGYQVVLQPLWIMGKDIQQGVKLLSSPFDRSQISSHVTPETAHPHSDPCYNVLLVDLPETPDSAVYAYNVSPVPGSKQGSKLMTNWSHTQLDFHLCA